MKKKLLEEINNENLRYYKENPKNNAVLKRKEINLKLTIYKIFGFGLSLLGGIFIWLY